MFAHLLGRRTRVRFRGLFDPALDLGASIETRCRTRLLHQIWLYDGLPVKCTATASEFATVVSFSEGLFIINSSSALLPGRFAPFPPDTAHGRVVRVRMSVQEA